MKQVEIARKNNPLMIRLTAGWCDSFLCKLRGLTLRKTLASDWGLVLVYPRDSKVDVTIHMLFVWFDLGIIWINDAGIIVDKQIAKSWVSLLTPKTPARYVLEIHPDQIHHFEIGDEIVFKKIVTD